MAWTRLDDKFLLNAKIQEAGGTATLLYIAGLLYSNSNLTDGFIPESALPLLYGMSFQTGRNKGLATLLRVGLWQEYEGDKRGFMINDFLDFNKSKAEIERISLQRGKAGKKGMESRWKKAPVSTEKEAVKDNKSNNKRYNKNIRLTLNPNNPKLTTSNKLELVNEENDLNKLAKFGVVFHDLTGIEPNPTPPILEKAKKLIDENVTVDEYRTAILEMQKKGYVVATIASPVNWALNNRNMQKKDEPDMGDYIPDTSNTIYVGDPDSEYVPDTSNTIYVTE